MKSRHKIKKGDMQMRRKTNLPELLAPAGDFDSLVAAVSAGADAVYVGGVRFGARAYARNFDIPDLTRAVEYCHLFGVKLYVTVNTLLFDKEMSEAVEFCRTVYELGVDAVIIADTGLMRVLGEVLPELELHASTQLSVHNLPGAEIAYGMGAKRVVLARELPLRDIREITEKSKAEIEVFLHGALCVCHSGQCLFSSLVGGRSGNRGECAQPCRLPYNDGAYPISLKDLSLASHIPELIVSGVSSLKIEGRMKSPEYVYTVTRIYRRLLDERRAANDEERELLSVAFSRGGFTDGYLTEKLNGMTGVRSESAKADTRKFTDTVNIVPKKKRVLAKASFKLGSPASLTLYTEDGKSFSATGGVPRMAQTHALSKEEISQRLGKTGATPLTLSDGDIEIELDGGVNLSPGEINGLRRAAVEGLLSCKRNAVSSVELKMPKCEKHQRRVGNTAVFMNPALLLSLDGRILSHFEISFVPLMSDVGQSGKYGVYVPPIIFEHELEEVKKALETSKKNGAMYALVGNISHLPIVKEAGLIPIGDFRLNITNGYARDAYQELGLYDTVLSAELTLPQARDLSGACIVYGRIPLMITERCFISDDGSCKGKCKPFSLKDRLGAKFALAREYNHRNLIFNSALTYMADKLPELERFGKRLGHYVFSDERAEDVIRVCLAYKRGADAPRGVSIRRIGMRRKE